MYFYDKSAGGVSGYLMQIRFYKKALPYSQLRQIAKNPWAPRTQ
jgi:hypothetical protein